MAGLRSCGAEQIYICSPAVTGSVVLTRVGGQSYRLFRYRTCGTPGGFTTRLRHNRGSMGPGRWTTPVTIYTHYTPPRASDYALVGESGINQLTLLHNPSKGSQIYQCFLCTYFTKYICASLVVSWVFRPKYSYLWLDKTNGPLRQNILSFNSIEKYVSRIF